MKKTDLSRIAFIGNYLPRKCGIATFTSDLCETTARCYPEIQCLAVVMNDNDSGYDYPPRVRFEISQEHLFSYQRAAEFLNMSDVDIVCLQHEYGIFGGQSGNYILNLIRNLTMPVVTNLHTILENPDPEERRVMQEIARLSDRLTVMSQRAITFLTDLYGVPEEKIDLIHHGIPDVPFADPSFYKDQFGVEGKDVLLTFGLLSKNKGIEYVIEALPRVVEEHPQLVYMILGTTHPKVISHEGEVYRDYLQALVREKDLEKNVIFDDRFVSLDELTKFLSAADIYITPYLNPAQIVSGTLAYTLGSGKPVISTPYWYAEELLADGRGLLVPFRDSKAIAEKILFLLDHEAERNAMRKQAYLYGREMSWPRVVERYLESFELARYERMDKPRDGYFSTLERAMEPTHTPENPPIKIDHLLRMTDGTGLVQHAVYSVPNYYEGYTTDDNARALLAMIYLEENREALGSSFPTTPPELATRYLALLWYAFNKQTGRFRNFLSYDRRWQEEIGSEDSHGRALWSLGNVLARSSREGLRGTAWRLFEAALPAAREFTSPRGWAFTLLGVHEYLRNYPGDRAVLEIRKELVQRLAGLYYQNSSPEWLWFEELVSYDNAVLPRAIILSGTDMGREDIVQIGFEALRWLISIQESRDGHFTPIGCKGFYCRGREKARFDQQPLEAQSTVAACLDAYRLTGERVWLEKARNTFLWFLGYNDLGLPLYDLETGGCRDGLHIDRLNQNQGAESTLAYFLSALEMVAVETELPELRGRAKLNGNTHIFLPAESGPGSD